MAWAPNPLHHLEDATVDQDQVGGAVRAEDSIEEQANNQEICFHASNNSIAPLAPGAVASEKVLDTLDVLVY